MVRVQTFLRSRRGRGLQRRGTRAEGRAERLLQRAGYRILERQPSTVAHVIVDGERRETVVFADLLAERDGRCFAVEVKTGKRRRPHVDTTRRQLLEYALTFDTDGLLLVDAEEARIREIRFEY